MNNSLHNATRAESSRSQDTVPQNIIAPLSNLSHIGRDQYNFNIHPTPFTPPGSASDPPQPGPAPFNDAPIDNLSIHFTGRKTELALIAKAFEQRHDVPNRCALYGIQGVGKSQLTYSWAKSTFASRENAYIMWISATTVEKLFQGFCRLLRFVNHPDHSHPDQNVRLEAARRWLEVVNTGNWLIVFDNVFPETVEFLRQHLPRVNGRGTILFTTRTRDVAVAVTSTAGERHEIIEVPLLNVEEAVELFCGHFDTGMVDPLSAKVKAIVKAVGCLPLAISHAAAYMDQSRGSLDDLLELYDSRHKIKVIGWEHKLSEYEYKSVAATFTSQLQDLDRQYPDASKLLRVIAFFDPESIPLETLITGAKAITEAQQLPTRSPFISSLLAFIQSPKAIIGLQQRPSRSPFTASVLALIQSPIARQIAITQLQACCLVAYHSTSQSPTFRIHDLIQLVVLENTRRSGLYEESFELAVELVCSAFWKIENPELPKWWPQCEPLVPHIQSLTSRQDISSTAKKTLLLANNRRGLYLSSRGRYLEAELLYESVMADRERLFGPHDLDTLAAMDNLAWVYRRRGRYVEAEMLFKRVLDGRKTRLGPKHRDTLNTMYRLAKVYSRQQRYKHAEDLLVETLQSQVSQFGSEHNDTLQTMNRLAEVYNSQQRYGEAKTLLTRVLEINEKLLGSEDRATLSTKYALADVHRSQQHNETAAELFLEVLHAREKELGSQHPDTLGTMYFLALVYISQDRNEDAEQLLVHVLAGQDTVYGLSHPFTQRTVNALSSVYERLGRVEDARMLKQRNSPPS